MALTETERKYHREKMREYRKKHPDRYRENQRRFIERHPGYGRGRNALRYFQLRFAVFTLLGNRCKLCGESDDRVLEIDHIENNGKTERQQYGPGNGVMSEALKSGGKGLVLLCANCHTRKHRPITLLTRLNQVTAEAPKWRAKPAKCVRGNQPQEL